MINLILLSFLANAADTCPVEFQQPQGHCSVSYWSLLSYRHVDKLWKFRTYCHRGEDDIDKWKCARGIQIYDWIDNTPDGGNGKVLISKFSPDLQVEYPKIFKVSDKVVLALFATSEGTAHIDETDYYQLVDQNWKAIESRRYIEVAKKMLPAGLEIRKGLRPDMKTLVVESNLYRPDDPNCCPTGGVARIQLALKNYTFTVESVKILPRPSE